MHRPGDIRVEDIAMPEARPGHARVKVAACGVCGSDLPRMLTKGAHVMPLVCGHEFSGYIDALGEGGEDFVEGELVTVPPMIPCMECNQCRRGHPSRCVDYDYFGSRRDGAYAEYVSVPLSNLVKVPQDMSPTAAAFVDPAAIALHAIWQGEFRTGESAAVMGCGPIGLFAIQWLKLMGAGDIVAIDLAEEKLAMAREAGATQTYRADELEEDLPVCHLIVEAAGAPASIDQAIRMTGPGGHIVFIGIPTKDVQLSTQTFSHFLRQEISLHGAWNSFSMPFPGDEWRTAIDKLASGELRWEFMITHDLSLDELPDMFSRFEAGSEVSAKVLFRPGGPASG
ncbi:galactitol-1-phosphate 5-dehydrogenase [Salinisphaera sp. SWV1]|uniref:galactitol-1-phosphate 5-dehydrogenase n=1 Tax=Salinisphaera sp. SWV1 TaxID=3454139 RepID=UPI003F879804